MAAISADNGVLLHQDYVSLTKETNRLRMLSVMEEVRGDLLAEGDLQEALMIAQFCLTALKKTAQILQKGGLAQLDPIVGENTCQVRAYAVITSQQKSVLQEEAERVLIHATELLKKVNQLRSKHSNLPMGRSPVQLLEHFKLNVALSSDMAYLVRCYILSCGKFFSMTRDGRESSGIDASRVRTILAKSSPFEYVERMLHSAKEQIARDTVERLQEIRLALPEKEQPLLGPDHIREVVTQSNLHLQVSCAFYNMKAVAMDLIAKRVPIVIIEHALSGEGPPLKLIYVGGKLFLEPLDPNEPVFVIEGFIPKGIDHLVLGEQIEKVGLLEIILGNVAGVPQYSENDDISSLPKFAQEEIAQHRAKGLDHQRILRIAHTHAGTLVNLREGKK